MKVKFDMADYDLSTFSKEGKIEDVKIGTKIWFKMNMKPM